MTARSSGTRSRALLAWWVAGVWCLGIAIASAGEPYTPTSDDEVLETLPTALLAGRDELSALRRRLTAQPNDVDLAAAVASRYVTMGGATSDPRYYGYARAALAPWWSKAAAPAPVLRLRAKIHERDHEYDQALADLRTLLDRDACDAQALIQLANLRRVQGDYLEASAACDSLNECLGGGPNISVLCRAPILAATGKAEEGYRSLDTIMPLIRSRLPDVLRWALAVQAETARVLGRDEQAEQHLLEALSIDSADYYALRAYADLLLDQGRGEEALPLLRDHTNDTGVLLRAAIAARQTGETERADQWLTMLEGRFEEIRLRGGTPHGRFESRCALELRNDATRALAAGLENWGRQKEQRDARCVLEAAVALNDADAAAPVIRFLKQHASQDVLLQRLIHRLEQSE